MRKTDLHPGELKRLRIGVTQRVKKFAESKNDLPMLYEAIYRDIKQNFNVNSYKEIKRYELLTVINFIENWPLKEKSLM